MDTDKPNAAVAAITPPPPSDGGEGRGEEAGEAARQVEALTSGTPLSPTLSPSEGERESERRWKSLSEWREPSSLYYGFAEAVAAHAGCGRFFIRVHPCSSVVKF